jgi:hypothetical protein
MQQRQLMHHPQQAAAEADCIFPFLHVEHLGAPFATSCRSSGLHLPSCAAYLVHHSQQAAEDFKLLKSPQTTVYFMLSFNLHRSIDVDHDQCLTFTD